MVSQFTDWSPCPITCLPRECLSVSVCVDFKRFFNLFTIFYLNFFSIEFFFKLIIVSIFKIIFFILIRFFQFFHFFEI